MIVPLWFHFSDKLKHLSSADQCISATSILIFLRVLPSGTSRISKNCVASYESSSSIASHRFQISPGFWVVVNRGHRLVKLFRTTNQIPLVFLLGNSELNLVIPRLSAASWSCYLWLCYLVLLWCTNSSVCEHDLRRAFNIMLLVLKGNFGSELASYILIL